MFSKLLKSVLPLLGAGLFATGCQTYNHQNHVIAYWQQGNVPAAEAEAIKQANENAKNKDAIVWRLEQAAVLRANGKYEDSNKAFDMAQDKIDDYAQKAKVRVGQEASALLSSQANLDYEGRSYDGIMLNTYKALNYLAMGDPDKARPEIIRAYQRQQDAVEANKKRIEETQAAAEKNKDKKTMEKAEGDPKFQTQMQGVTANLDTVKVYADYVNPFTVYLDGLYFMANAADNSDLERANKSFERVSTYAPDNAYVKQDLAAMTNLFGGKPLEPTTYVIFETGCAPIRDQIRIDIPIIVSKVSYVGAAFPTLKFQDNYAPSLMVSANGTNVTTAAVASMDGIVSLDFKNDLPVVITKTIAATVVKAVAAYVANDAARQAGGDLAGLLTQVATAAYEMAVNIADTRTWTTLPKEFQVCRIPTPADGRLELVTATGIKTTVTLGAPGAGSQASVSSGTVQASLNSRSPITVVYVKSISATAPLLVSQLKIK